MVLRVTTNVPDEQSDFGKLIPQLRKFLKRIGMTKMRRIQRSRRLTPEEAAKNRKAREQVDREVPELIRRHRDRAAVVDQVEATVKQLKHEREKRGLSLADLTRLTGMDRSAISKLENGQRENPTMDTLARYAEAVGKRLVVSLNDA